jgi:hypothetical protein
VPDVYDVSPGPPASCLPSIKGRRRLGLSRTPRPIGQSGPRLDSLITSTQRVHLLSDDARLNFPRYTIGQRVSAPCGPRVQRRP